MTVKKRLSIRKKRENRSKPPARVAASLPDFARATRPQISREVSPNYQSQFLSPGAFGLRCLSFKVILITLSSMKFIAYRVSGGNLWYLSKKDY